MFTPLKSATLLLLTATSTPLVLAQTSTVIVIPSPLPWQDALARCQELGHNIYPLPATPTDPVYNVLKAQPPENGERYWISRRAGGTCTCLKRYGAEGDLWLEEMPCGDAFPAFCQG